MYPLVCVLVSLAPTAAGAAPTAERAHAIGVEACAYFYPLVTMDVTRRQRFDDVGFKRPVPIGALRSKYREAV